MKPKRSIIPKNEVFIVGSGNTITADTLIMHDASIIYFNPATDGFLKANNAIIGNKCLISSKGLDGAKAEHFETGEDGQNGGNLTIYLDIKQLKKLTIDSRGGNGGSGANGKHGIRGKLPEQKIITRTNQGGVPQTIVEIIPGYRGSDGSDATQGGSGGNGGNITFTYKSDSIIPIFNRRNRQKHSITILHTGGRVGRSGTPGEGGIDSKNGMVIYSEVRDSSDGKLELINATYSSVKD